MTPERFRQIDSILEELLACPPDERPALIEERCGDDSELVREVLALIGQEEELESFLGRPMPWQAALPLLDREGQDGKGRDAAALDSGDLLLTDLGSEHLEPTDLAPGAAARRAAAAGDLPAGELIGPYRILDLLGHGGMGSVFRAERDDDVFRGQVAIKLLRPGFESAELLRRFRAETQILAGLRHPNISRLLDGGTHRDGRPYFVLELVEGQPIDQYCRQHDHSIDQRLALFEQVCDGVEFAHRNLVVHRDIKPANILVTASGRPVLLDFGIAKVLDTESFAYTLQDTASHLRPMTPSYASPEQFLGQAVTTSSDVYSLGVLFYLLLCGSLPRDLRGKSPLQVERMLRNELPRAPSEVAAEQLSEREKSRQEQSHELDSIALMALRFEPEGRYGSVEQLRQDVRRYRQGLPLLARGNSRVYQLGKLARKYWLASLTLTTVILLLAALAVTMSLSASRLDRQRQAAETERDKAQTVANLMVQMFAFADPVEGASSTLTVSESLERSLPLVRERIEDQPEVQASLLLAIGQVYHGLGSLNQAEEVLTEALELQRQVLGDESFEVSQTLSDLALLYGDRGEPKKALAMHEEVLSLRERILGPDHIEVALTLQNMAVEEGLLGRFGRAEDYISRALTIRESLLGPDHPSVGIAAQILGNMLSVRSQFEQAAALHQRALRISEERYGPVHINVSYAVHAIGEALLMQQETAATEPLIMRVLSIREQLLGEEHLRLSPPLLNLCLNEILRGNLMAGQAFLDRARTIVEASSAEDGYDLGAVEGRSGLLANRRGDLTQATAHLEKSRKVFDLRLGAEARPPEWILIQAENELLRSRPAEARERLQRLLTRMEDQSLDRSIDYPAALRLLAVADRALGDLDAARQASKRSLEILEGFELLDMILAIEARLDLAHLNAREDRWQAAIADFEAALKQAENRLARNPDSTSRRLKAEALLRLGGAMAGSGRPGRASELFDRAAETLSSPGRLEIEDSFFLQAWAEAHQQSGRPDRARPAVEELERRGGLGAFSPVKRDEL